MNLERYYNKVRRELYKPLSQMGLKQASTNYFGLDLKIPLLNGLGAGFLVPDHKWMSDCLSVFLHKKQGLVVDIGVNIGLYMIKLRALDATREYVGFEPNAVCNHYTQQLILANNFQNVRVLPFALSDKKELRQFYIKRNADKMGSLNDYARFGDDNKIALDLFTFPADEFIELLSPQHICVFKIDVEGSELEVLRGLKQTLQKYRPYLFCEIWQLPDDNHPTFTVKLDRFKQIRELLKSIDYKLLGLPLHNSGQVEVIESVDEFRHSQRSDFIMVHESEMDDLRQDLSGVFNK